MSMCYYRRNRMKQKQIAETFRRKFLILLNRKTSRMISSQLTQRRFITGADAFYPPCDNDAVSVVVGGWIKIRSEKANCIWGTMNLFFVCEVFWCEERNSPLRGARFWCEVFADESPSAFFERAVSWSVFFLTSHHLVAIMIWTYVCRGNFFITRSRSSAPGYLHSASKSSFSSVLSDDVVVQLVQEPLRPIPIHPPIPPPPVPSTPGTLHPRYPPSLVPPNLHPSHDTHDINSTGPLRSKSLS